MAGEAINLHSRIGMAGLTELTFSVDGNKLAARILGGMAIDAAGETVLNRANTVVHSLVTIMFHEIKMITTHDFDGLDTLLTSGCRNVGLRHVAIPNDWRPQSRTAEDQTHDPNSTQPLARNSRHGNEGGYSPIPMSI
jgi:hypothetical protein